MSSRGKKSRKRSRLLGILFLLPALAFITYALYVPFVWNGVLSFQKWDGFADPQWIGLKNYSKALTDSVSLLSLKNSVLLGVVSTLGAVILGLSLAAFVYKVYRKEGALYRLIAFMPIMLPAAVVGLLFTFFFNSEMGLLNNLLRLVGLNDITKAWLENRNTVVWCIAFVNIWKMSGLTMMLSFAAMQMLPTDIFEQSKLDGIGYGKQFFRIILPLIKPTVLLSAVYTLAVNFKSYDIVSIMTGGGPGTTSYVVPINMVKNAFSFGDFGYAAAQGVVLTVIVVLIVVIMRKTVGSESYEY
ncbi:MAG: sugar ABC transporter permease [Lachnospiraceae bacterium]|jgi:raffinose/stachyose/melibiose transport system permease protein|nr:sugar ABC transporter permease [Lachnospiraceae bacterium]